MEVLWEQVNKTEWQELAVGCAMPTQQHPAYGAAVVLLGGQVRRAVILDAGVPVGLAQVMTRVLWPVRLSLLSRGPVWLTPPTATAHARALAALAQGSGVLLSTPEEPLKARGLIPLVAPRRQAVIDLRPDPGVLRAGLNGKWRNRLVRAEATGPDICARRPGASDLDWLLRAEAEMRKVRRYRALPPSFTYAWQKANPDALRYFEARVGRRRVAAMLMLLHAPWATYHIGWSDDEGRRVNAHNALMWRAICDLKSRGFTALDLGPVDWLNSPGLARFKTGTGARVAPLGATSLVLPPLTRRRW